MSKKLSRELIAQKVKSDRIESIRNLNLWGSNIEDISIIREMPSLEIVSLSVNKIRTLAPFANLQNLRELYLRRNLIANLNEIKYLTNCENLTVLWLSENPICDNPNYRAVIICILPQLQKLDDIPITDAEREKAEKKLSGNLEEDEDGNEEEQQQIPKENKNNKNAYNQNQRSDKKNYEIRNNNSDDEYEENNFYENKNNQRKIPNKKNNIRQGRSNFYDNEQEDDNEYKPKIKAQSNKYNDMYNYKYDDRPIRANSGMVPKHEYYNENKHNYGNKYEDDYGEKNEKKKENSNILNCVINLLKELSPNELQIVKREIDRLNY